MYHAKDLDFENIMSILKSNKEFLAHVRSDYIRQMIINNGKQFNFKSNLESKNKNQNLLIIENDVIISYNFYKRSQTIGTVQAVKGDCILHQIVAKTKGTAGDVLQRFFKFVNRQVYLSVRSDNDIAKNFYLRNNMKLVGKTSWAKNTLPGDVFVHNKSFDWSTEKW